MTRLSSTATTILSVTTMSFGVLLTGLGLPMALNKVPRSQTYGFQTAKSMSSTELGGASNVYCGKAFVLAGAVTVLLSIVLLRLYRSGALALPVLLGLTVVCQLFPVVVAVLMSINHVRGL